jgi:hypothetical protein
MTPALNGINITLVVPLHALALNLAHSIADRSPKAVFSNILLPRIPLRIKHTLTGRKRVIVHGLQRSFAHKDREFGLLSNIRCLSVNSRVNVVGVGAGRGKVVDVRVNDKVG